MNILRAMKIAGLLCIWVVLLYSQHPHSNAKDTVIARAKLIVDLLAKRDNEACYSYFDSTMKVAMPPAKIGTAWDSVLVHFGEFKKIVHAWIQPVRVYDVTFVTCRFEKDSVDVRVVLDEKLRVAGLYFSRPMQPLDYKASSYVKKETFHEEDVLVGSGRWSLHGTLSMPVGQSDCPAVVLVHGSGPNDRDETIGPNKPFKDIAWGLASNGIAVLRYEKRTREHGLELVALKQTFTVNDETIDDALLAVELLRHTKRIDPHRIFVLGHSLGGMLAPRIAARDTGIAGLVILAGATQHLEDLLVEQTTYLLSLGGISKSEQDAQIKRIEGERDKVKKLTKADTSSTDAYFAAPASYWIDLQNYDPPSVAQNLKLPMFFLQGERDYQVTKKDYHGWTTALRGRPNVTFKTYPTLNHLFMPGEGQSAPSEYQVPGHVLEEVVTDIVQWIKK
ncbi:MAG TPA: alpha/beta fold hydrolase [Bacteroidota bacterium]|nr:alpha/beta fold hydrolase [Bacteroidota bacterium]